MVRLRRTTHARLRELEAIWREAYARGASHVAPDESDRIGLDRIIMELLERDAAHRRRSNPKGARTIPPITGRGEPASPGPDAGESPPAAKGRPVNVDDSSPLDTHGGGTGFSSVYTDSTQAAAEDE